MTLRSPQVSRFWLNAVVLGATLFTFGVSLNLTTVVLPDVDEVFEITQFVSLPLLNFFSSYWANGQLPHVLLTKLFGAIYWDIVTLRYGSVLAGTLCIPVMYQLARVLFDRRVAVLSAILLSLTATHIKYTAYARGYSLMLLLSLATIYCFNRAVKTEQRRWWVAFATVLAINIHNHIFTVFLAAALVVFVLGWLWTERDRILPQHKKQLVNIFLASGLTFLLLLPMPILVLLSRNTADSLSVLLADQKWPTSFPPLSVNEPLNIVSPLFQMSYTFSPVYYPGWLTYVFVAFFVIGIIVGLKYQRFRWSTILLVLVLFLPPVLMTVTTTILGPWFYALRRYFLFVMIPYLMSAGMGMVWVADWLKSILLAYNFPRKVHFLETGILFLLIILVSFPIFSYVAAEYMVHPVVPYAIARYMQAHAQSNDIILCVPDRDWRITPRESSCSLMLNLYPELAPNTYFWDELATYQTLQEFLNPETECTNHYVHMPYPHFEMECEPAANQKDRNLWLILWREREIAVAAAQTDPLHPLTVTVFDETEILYLENKDSLPHALTQAGEIALTESKTPLRKLENYISLITAYVGTGDIERATFTLDEAAFVSRWPEAVKRLAELQAQFSFLPVAFEPHYKIQVVWNNEITLVGVDQDLTTVQPERDVPILLSFYWQILKPVSTNYQVFLHLIDNQGALAATFDYQPFDGSRPFHDWPAGQIIRETRTFLLPAELSPGTYTLIIGIYEPDTLERLPITGNHSGESWILAEWGF